MFTQAVVCPSPTVYTLTNNRAERWGGAIFVYSGSMSILESTLTNNSADYGGAISFTSAAGSLSIFELYNLLHHAMEIMCSNMHLLYEKTAVLCKSYI